MTANSSLSPSWFVRRDIDGFFALALDNLIQILLLLSLCKFVLGFPGPLIFGKILPGVAISLIVGNFYYSWLAFKQAKAENREDITALPYGINTVSLIAYVFLVMLPVKLAALSQGQTESAAVQLAWEAGLVACLGSGLLELLGAFVGDRLRQWAPRAAMLSTLSGIAITFIAIDFLFRTFAHPIVGLVPFGVILLSYFGGVNFGIPGGLLAVILGTALSWMTGLANWNSAEFTLALEPLSLYFPRLWIGELWRQKQVLLEYFSIILPMGLFNLVGSLQNLESAEAAGDRFPTAPCLAANGIGTILAAVCGSCFPTTIYIGHPGWKQMGARIGYSWLNGVVIGLLCLTGAISFVDYFIPIEAGMAIVLWIGIVIVAQSFTTSDSQYAPAVVIGILPGIAAWGALIAKSSLRVAGVGQGDNLFGETLISQFQQSGIAIDGAFALEQGVILSAMILSAITVYIIDGKFRNAALWSIGASALSWIGLMHSFAWSPSDTIVHLGWGTGSEWAIGYLLLAILLMYASWQGRTAISK